MTQRKYTLKKDPRDLRDIHFRSVKYSTPAALPKKVDLRKYCSEIVDQGQLGSCTANAIASGLYEFLENQKGAGPLLVRLSRLFLYWHERKLEGTIDQDSGAYIRDGMKVLQTIGCAPEKDFPYDISTFTHTPSTQAEKDAAAFKIDSYHRIIDISGLKAALAEGKPVVFGMSVYASFESEHVAKTGKVPYPKKTKEQLLGGHALLAVGYRDYKREGTGVVIVRNSWGAGWGDKGYCYIPYKVFQDASLVSDMWTVGA